MRKRHTRLLLYLMASFIGWCSAGMLSSARAQLLSEQQKTELNQNLIKIDEDADFADSGWGKISGEFDGKRVVALGEFNHGSREVFESRTSLIKYLHRHLDYKVILFESGIGELIAINQNKESLTSREMTYGFFGGWRTTEFEELMGYIRDNKLETSGYDVQRTGGGFTKLLDEKLRIYDVDSLLFTGLESRYTEVSDKLRQRVAYEEIKEQAGQLILDYRRLYEVLDGIKEKNPEKEFLLIKKTLENRAGFLKYYLSFLKDGNWNKRWAARDSIMAGNVVWLAGNIYPGQKIIVVGHNFHIARFNKKEQVMGEWLSENYGDAYFAMGVFAGAGSYSNNAGKEESMSSPEMDRLDIKHIIKYSEGFLNYLKIPQAKEKALKWLDEEIIVNDTFIDLSGSNQMNLFRHFDGLLLVQQVNPPVSAN